MPWHPGRSARAPPLMVDPGAHLQKPPTRTQGPRCSNGDGRPLISSVEESPAPATGSVEEQMMLLSLGKSGKSAVTTAELGTLTKGLVTCFHHLAQQPLTLLTLQLVCLLQILS
ncbi:hypothetical protein C0992_000256 [Termitomyces sp. T32_za158]|nr:hypothetical protein C0992_000256 [Termitomyces sp. T32_za158]